MTDQDTFLLLDRLLEQDISFAIFRLPHETTLRFVMQKQGTPSVFQDINDLNDQKGFVIAPFRTTASTPILVIRPDCTNLHECTSLFDSVNNSGIDRGVTKVQQETVMSIKKNKDKAEYSELFNRFLQPLTNGEMKKLVLSRSKTIDRKGDFSPGRSFLNAVERYPYSYVYLLHTPQSGTWLGSTPEILLKGRANEWQTVALAGTRYPNSGTVTWDDKNLREQHLVTSYLLKQLSSFQITPEINGPYTIKAGNLAHLRTDINFYLSDNSKPGTLLKTLHPTPAISGLPKNEAYRFIQEKEENERLYYSGFLGMLDIAEETNIYVNLRCMLIEEKSLTLFAGSGLLVSSKVDDEWEETEQKLKTMLDIIG